MPLPSVTVQTGYAPAAVVIRTEKVQEVLREAPGVLNTAYNRALKRIGGVFGAKFTEERLRGGGITVRKKGQAAAKSGGPSIHPRLPRAMVLAGFKGQLKGPEGLEHKALSIRTSNPVMTAHEHGVTINSTGKSMRVRFSKVQSQYSGIFGAYTQKARDIWKNVFVVKIKGRTFLVARRSLAKRTDIIPLAHLKRSVRVRPRLGYRSSWSRFSPEAIKRLGEAQQGAVRRLEQMKFADAGAT